jgi:hypothetical protein
MPVANKGAALEFRLFYGCYWAIFHIPLGNLAQFVIGAPAEYFNPFCVDSTCSPFCAAL